MKMFQLLCCLIFSSVVFASPLQETVLNPDTAAAQPADTSQSLEVRYFRYLEYLRQPRKEKVLFGLFSKSTPELDQVRITEMRRYLWNFPHSEHSAQVLVMTGDAYQEANQPAMALGAYLEQLVVFPESALQSKTQATILKLAGDNSSLRDKKAQISQFLSGGILFENYQQNYFRYLQLLHQLNHPDIADWFFDTSRRYLNEFPDAQNNERVYFWTASMYATLELYEHAVYSYTKIEYLYPASSLLPTVLYNQALVYRDHLKKYEEAATSLEKLYQKYPEDSLAVDSNMLLAQTYSEHLDKQQKAIEVYQRVIDRYPESAKALDAYFAQAKIYREKTRDPAAAVDRYMTVIKTYPDSTRRDARALRNAGDVYADEIKDYYTAVQTYQQYATKYPFDKEVPDRLLKAASLAETQLNDPQQAINLLETIVNKYPNASEVRAAERRLPKLQEKAKN